MNTKLKYFAFCCLTICILPKTGETYNYISPSPILGENSLYTLNSITAKEYEEQFGKSEVFADAEVVEKDTVVYHYYQYAQKPDTISSSPIKNGNGGLDVHGGWYAKFGTFDGQALNLRYGSLGHVYGDFINNAVDGSSGYGGALFMENTTIAEITGDFVNNHIGGYLGNGGSGVGNAYGGAMYVHNGAKISNGISGNFINNYVSGGRYVMGGAIDNDQNSIISSIRGKFIGNNINTRASALSASGGAIFNLATIGNISADFIYNHIDSKAQAAGGAVSNENNINSIVGNFINNYASAAKKRSQGGAIYNHGGTIGSIAGNFIANYASISYDGLTALGGAIYTDKNLLFENDGENYFFSNNYTNDYRGKIYNSIFAETNLSAPEIIFSMQNKAVYIINDGITGGITKNYNISGYDRSYKTVFTSADSSGTVFLGDDIINSDISLNGVVMNLVKYTHSDNTITTGSFGNDETARSSLTLNNAVLGLHNSYFDKLNLKNYTAKNNAVLHINVGKDENGWASDLINISGNIQGQTNVIVYSLSKDNNKNASVVFVKAPQDTIRQQNAFVVSRVYGSPYMWKAVRNYKGETSGSTWYLVSNTVSNPDIRLPAAPSAPVFIPDRTDSSDQDNDDNGNNNDKTQPVHKPQITFAPEVIAGIGLHEAAIEQTRSVVRNVSGKVASGREYCPGCGIYPTSWDSKALCNVWVMAQGESANIDKPADMDAKIWGVEGGFDLQNDVNNTLGVFASYRKGEYDLSGKGSKYYSKLGSEIDIDSYLTGLYYRYDKNMNWLFATVYGGVQQADVKTDDGMSKFDSDGVELGAGLEAGHSFALNKSLTLDPSLGVYYTQISFDKAHDNVGKSYKWDDIKHVEAEAAVKLSQQFENAKVYVKPSLIQTYTDGDSVKISGLNKADTYHDQTLGRIEIGGNYGFTDSLNGYVWSNYTYGSSYDSTAAGFGINYAW